MEWYWNFFWVNGSSNATILLRPRRKLVLQTRFQTTILQQFFQVAKFLVASAKMGLPMQEHRVGQEPKPISKLGLSPEEDDQLILLTTCTFLHGILGKTMLVM